MPETYLAPRARGPPIFANESTPQMRAVQPVSLAFRALPASALAISGPRESCGLSPPGPALICEENAPSPGVVDVSQEYARGCYGMAKCDPAS